VSAFFVARFTLVELAFALSACTPRPATAPLPQGPPDPPLVAVVTDAAAATELNEPEDAAASAPTEVVVAHDWDWLTAEPSTVPYSVSLSNGDWARSKVNALLDTSDAGLGVTPRWFGQLNTKAEDASRWYALAFHAENATPPEKVAVALLAAEGALSLAHRLDEVGLTAMPRAWRADPTLAVSFEDVAHGPARRWRDEGLALVQLCIETAFDLNVHDASTKKCLTIRKTEGTVAIRRAFAREAGARGCRCSPGDPLCSEGASWCSR
jgi:hypothetical protein